LRAKNKYYVAVAYFRNWFKIQ